MKRLNMWVLILVGSLFLLNIGIPKAESASSEIVVYDYNTGETLIHLLHHPPGMNVGFIIPHFTEKGRMELDTNSQLLKMGIDREGGKIYVTSSGPDGSNGYFLLKIHQNLISPEDLKIELDNKIISFTVENEFVPTPPEMAEYWPEESKVLYGEFWTIYVQYKFTTHFITITLGKPIQAQQPMDITILFVMIGAMVVAAMVYWFKFRR